MVNPVIEDTLDPRGTGAEINATSFVVTLKVGIADPDTLEEGEGLQPFSRWQRSLQLLLIELWQSRPNGQ